MIYQEVEVHMICFTEEVASVLEALDKIYWYSVTTYRKEPTCFIMGQELVPQFEKEMKTRFRWLFHGQRSYSHIPIVVTVRPGLDIGIPNSVAA